LAYPPSIGPQAVYFKEDMFDAIDYAIFGYGNLSKAAGPYAYPTPNNTIGPIEFCMYHYKNASIYAFNESYSFDPEIDEFCMVLPEDEIGNGVREIFSTRAIEIDFLAFIRATLNFSLKTVNLRAKAPLMAPDCYLFQIQILLDNAGYDGQIVLSLDSRPTRLICHGNTQFAKNDLVDEALQTVFTCLVIIVCLISFVLCTRALFRANTLKRETCEYFVENFRRDLSVDGQLEFLNLWYVMIVINDILLVIGSIMKEQIDRKNEFGPDDWRNCSLFLGLGNMLVWFGVLRYLGFFKTYNVVILTIKCAAPKMVRFLICALIIFAGFAFCGWLVFGPYHMKFRSFSSTCECLYSLLNGDDMFATFFSMSQKSKLLWYISRVYLYVFISLFIYVVLSLFVSVIVDCYETIKGFYENGFPKTDLKLFMEGLEEYSSLN
jgi:mucolipin 3